MTAQEVADEYRSSLSDLTLNSKPLITMLTMLAEENLAHASVIVKVIEEQIHSASTKLPLMYLIDSILKNVHREYIELFKHNIISIFTYVFEKSDEKTRKKLYELRHTWNDVFAKSKLYMLDTKVQQVDPAWPVAAGPSGSQVSSKPNIHINPNMIKGASRPLSKGDKDIKDLEILKREGEILALQKKRIILEQQQKDREKSRHQKPEPDPKPEPTKPVTKPAEDSSSVSANKRAEFLRSYKIKKKSQSQLKEEAKVGSTIHVDPRRVHQVLPQVAASVPVPSRDPRTEGSRDPRVKPEKTSRDPRIAPETSRDPRIKAEASKAKPEAPRVKADTTRSKVEGSRDPRLNAASTAESITPAVASHPKTNEQPVTSSRDPRVAHKEPEKKSESSKTKKEKDKEKESLPSKRKKLPKIEPKDTRETRSSKSAPKEKDIISKPKPPEVVEPPPVATFKPRKTRQRTYKHREESPDEKNSSQSSGSGKRSRGDRSSSSDDSDDSDHYMGNVPNQSQQKHISKKAKKPDHVTNPPVISDTDYRHFNPSKRPSTTNENISPPTKDKIMDEETVEPPQGLGLFSNKDVDYRQILPRPMPVIPPPNIPSNVSSAFSGKDQDDRKPSGRGDVSGRDPLASLNPPDNQDLGLVKSEMGPPDSITTPSRVGSDLRMRKPSFNSPHAASWEKFREKNPEFKEYTRQASISESERSHPLDEGDLELEEEQHHGYPVRIRDMNVPFKHDRKRSIEGRPQLYDDEGEGMESPRQVEVARENYKVILSQAEEQRRRGEINMGQYNQLLTTVVTLMEKDKIQQVRDRDRHLMRTPQPQMLGSDDIPGGEDTDDPFGPSNIPPGGPGRPLQPPPPGNNGIPPGVGPSIGHPGGGPPQGGPPGPNMPPSHPGHPGGPPVGHPGGPPRPDGPPSAHRAGPGGQGGHGRGHPGNENFGRGGRGSFRNDMPVGGPRGGGMIAGRGGGSNGRGGPMPDSDDGWGRGGGGRRDRGGRRGRGFSKGNRGWGGGEMMEDEWIGEPELPFLPDEYLHMVDRDNVTKKIEIDRVKREVRTYGQTAVVFLDSDDPRILSFSEGQVTVVFDGGLYRMPLRIGEDYKEFTFEGKSHRVRLGPPSQELMLDDVGYHCLIGGDPVTVHFDGAPHTIALEGKPPNVNISPVRNTEFVAGTVQLVIQAQKFVQLFLDARPQRFSIDGRAFVIKFIDSLRAVTINNQKFPVEFGGLPLSICVRGYRRFLSFGNLPPGIIPGQVSIRGMEGEGPSAPRGPDNPGNMPVVRPPGPIPPAFDMVHQGSPGTVPNNLRPPGPVPQGSATVPNNFRPPGPVPQGAVPQGSPAGVPNNLRPPGPVPQGAVPQGPPIQRPVLHGPPQPPTLKDLPHKGSPKHPGPGFPGPPHPPTTVAPGPGPGPMPPGPGPMPPGPGPMPPGPPQQPPQQAASVQGMPQPPVTGQGMPQQTGPAQGMPQQAGPGQGLLQQAGPGQGMPQQTGPSQGMPQPAGPGRGMPQPAGPGQGIPQSAGPGQGIPQPAGPGQGIPQQVVPGQGIPQQTGPIQGMPQQPVPSQGMPQHTSANHESQIPQGGGPSSTLPKPPVPLQGPPPPVPPTSGPTVMAAPPLFPFMSQPPPPIGIPVVPPAINISYTTSELPAPPDVNKPPPVTSMPIESLLANLQRMGMIGSKVKNKEEEKKDVEEEEEKEREADERIPIELMLRSENLRKRRKWLIESVYRGMQCSSCGLRYPPEQTVQYSHHLDWHFRKNKKQQESTKKANTRKFYFSIDDWLQYEEIEDLEERVPSMFETEGTEEAMDTDEVEIPSVPVTSGVVPEGSSNSLDVCPTCLDKFQCFFHQETEEWRYRNAIQVEGLNYHPSCHQDNLRAEEAAKLEAEKEAAEKESAEKEMAEADEKDEKESDKDAVMEDAGKEEDKKKEDKGDQEATEMETDTQRLEEEESQDVPMESQPSVTTKLDELTLGSTLPVRIKEEPLDVEDEPPVFVPEIPSDLNIKKEIKKEPEEHNEDDLLIRIPEDDDENILPENDESVWSTPPVAVNAAETDIASSIDGNTELTTADTTETNTTKAKIVFNVSKPVTNSNNDVNNVNDKNNDLNSNVVTEDEYEEFIPPPFTVDYERKPAFKGVELIDQPMEARGFELSGLCSIM